ncbi:hydrolase [Erwinia sp. OLTSP20]|uniref:HAD family hydrolase n=1 Tax=unclassified Erwinia TaxID=2622719 RepID=UPI000C17A914|nr:MULTISPECIES: HAD-IA family hydrolase [unclassified Erwinia]PIJ49152.1 hydrolase [Erwinia sp. OAMSP11]PIJ70458.1 hydrolase [Erwinia sp. OLSSP12]PIJ79951.1 hydrolase [Erwinia sp. OLCASP19]PIJ81313.1 hydrolase [Erwinia sp. OLMTSP26]PIJ83872.1 hydrolase [Erwinia sp. OLMDSP33]
MKPWSVIFDIDGVIVDSEQLHFEVLKNLQPEATYGITPEELIGLSLEETLLHIGIGSAQHAEITRQIIDAYKAELGARYLRPGISALIQHLVSNQISFGFVSTAPRDICLANIATLGLTQTYPLISGDDMERTKPYPDPYLAMLQRLGASPEQTLVIEDTDIGIQSAISAGIRQVYAWPHALSGMEHYTRAYQVIRNLNEIDILEDLLVCRVS